MENKVLFPFCSIGITLLSMAQEDRPQTQGDAGILTEKKTKTRRPPMYRVMLINDDYTTMDFVVYILETVFGKSKEEAHQLMLQVHQSGMGVCGIYSKEIAETKVQTVIHLARKEGFPLQCVMELA